jgi:hypothetical protein
MSGWLLLPFLALIPARIAYKRGHSFWQYYIFGIALLIVAIPVAIFAAKDQEELNRRMEKKSAENGLKKCNECFAFIPSEARRCQYCGCEVRPTADDPHGPVYQQTYARERARLDHETATKI